MRRFLLTLSILSILGGCLASASHGVCVPKLLPGAGKQHSSAKMTSASSGRMIFDLAASCLTDADDADMEDDEHGGSFLPKKFKANPKYLPAVYHNVTLTSLKRCNLSLAAIHGSSMPKYIAQMIFRV